MKRSHAMFLLAASTLAGCAASAPTTRPTDIDQRQRDALNDPFSYGPAAYEPRSISGRGGTTDLDRRELRKDLDSLFNP